MGIRPIQIALLTEELANAVAPFATIAKEDELSSVSLGNFRTVAAQCMEERRKELESFLPDETPPPKREMLKFVSEPCRIENYRKLKQLLGLRPRNDDARMVDSTVVMRKLEAKIQPYWAQPLDQLAAFEHAPIVLSQFIAQLRGNQITNPHAAEKFTLVENKDAVHVLTKLQLYDARIKRMAISLVEISLGTNLLEGGMKTFENLLIKVDGRNIPPKEVPYILPDILQATEQWAYQICDWPLFMGGIILFDFNKATLNDHATVYLDVLALVMKKYPQIKLGLTGHADRSGESDYNKDLAKRRAESVRVYLVARLGSSAKERVTTSSVGEEEPIDTKEDGTRNDYNRHVSLDPSVSELGGRHCMIGHELGYSCLSGSPYPWTVCIGGGNGGGGTNVLR